MNKKINKNKAVNNVEEVKIITKLQESKLGKLINKFKSKSSRGELIQYGLIATLLGLCIIPEVLASATLENQIDSINTLTTGKGKTLGISFAAIGAAIFAIIKSSPMLAVTMICIGVVMAYYLEWIAAGMKIGVTAAKVSFNFLADNLNIFS